MTSFLAELQRRNVFRVAIAYLAGAWLLTEVSGTLFPLFGFGDTPARIVVILLAIGFPLFLVFSWVFEITPEGLKLEKDVRAEASVTVKTGKTLDRAIIVLLALALGYFAFDKFILEPQRKLTLEEEKVAAVAEARQEGRSEALVESYGDQSIVVLPFVNLSSDPEQEYFSDGISEELLNLLAKIPELRVISRSSAFSFKGKDVPLPEVARQLHVEHVLEGSIRKAGDRVRITAQLIEARSDTHLWSEVYDRELGDIFAIQDEIAGAIGQALELKLARGAAAGPAGSNVTSVDAYDLYLQGRELVRLRDPDSLKAAMVFFERALRHDANFAPAHAFLAIAAILQVQVGASTVEDAKLTAAPHLDRAGELEPNLVELQHGRALLAGLELKPEAAIGYARRALALNPSYVDALTVLGASLEWLGRYEESAAAVEQVVIVDPLNVIGLLNYIEHLNLTGRNDEAHEFADRLLTQSPRWGYEQHAYTSALWEGKIAEGLEWALKAGREGGGYGLAQAFFTWVGEFGEARRLGEDWALDMQEGHVEDAIRKTERNLTRDPELVPNLARAGLARYFAGRYDEALPLLEQALDLSPANRPIAFHLGHYATMALAEARRRSGDEAGAQAAAEIVRQDHAARIAAGRRNENQDIWGALIAAFDNDVDGALAYLQSAVQRGVRDKGVFDEVIFDGLRADPRFTALQQELDAILATEHEKVLQLICFDNPVPDDWQPLPETCAGVVKQRES